MKSSLTLLATLTIAACGGNHQTDGGTLDGGTHDSGTSTHDGGTGGVTPASWVVRSSGTSADLVDVATGGGSFVAVGVNVNSSGAIVRSTDGASWNPVTVPSSASGLSGVAYGTNGYVAVGNQATIVTSSDGTTWAQQSANLSGASLSAVGVLSSGLLAVGPDLVVTSPDGVTWTRRSPTLASPGINELSGVVRGSSGAFVLSTLMNPVSGETMGFVYETPDPTIDNIWNQPYMGGMGLIAGVATSSGFVGVGVPGAVVSSTDGTTFSTLAIGQDYALSSIALCGSQLVVAASDSVGGYVLVAPSTGKLSVSSFQITTTTPSDLYAVACSASEIVAVGANGTIVSTSY